MVRLLHVLEATVGGTRRHLLDLCLHLPRDEFQQHVVCSVLRDESFLEDVQVLLRAGIEVTILPMVREISPVSDWQCLRKLQMILKQWQPALLHGHSAKGGFLARWAASRIAPRPKVIYNPHSFPFQMRVSRGKQSFYRSLERAVAPLTDCLIVPCESQRQIALREHIIPESRLALIPNGVNADAFATPQHGGGIRRELRITPQAPLVGTVAALTPQKAVSDLVRAASAVRRERPEVQFIIAGSGPLEGQVRSLARKGGMGEGIHFLGHRDDVPDLLAAMDLFVLPSLWEGLPYALLEAGAAGVPVLATAIAGNVDLIENGKTGFLARPADPLDLAVQLFAALDHPERAQLGQALQERIRTQYTLQGMIDAHVKLYRGLVGS